MNRGQKFLAFLGRICIASIFIWAAVGKVVNWQASESEVVRILCDWHIYTAHLPSLEPLLEQLLSVNTILLAVAVALEFVGGCMLLFSWQVRAASVLLLLFLLPVTILAHHFWMLEGSSYQVELSMFLKNLAISGGLFTILAFGKGPANEIQ